MPGSPGADGQNVTGTALSPGDAHCPHGGSSFTAANGTFYACNGADGSGGFGTGYQTVGTGQVAITADGNDVVSLTIPNGAPQSAVYLVTARIGVSLTGAPGGGQSALASCVLMDGDFPLDNDSVTVSLVKQVMVPDLPNPPVPGYVAGNQASSMTLVGGDSFSAGAVLHVRCSGFPPDNAGFTGTGKIVAIKGG